MRDTRCKGSKTGFMVCAAFGRTRFSFLTIFACLALAAFSTGAGAQAHITASRAGDLQIGGGFVFGNSPYGQPSIPGNLTLRGGSIYSTFDFREHLGVEAEVHQVSASQDSTIYERTYEVGARYHRTYGRFLPYGKVMIGRGVFNFQNNVANLAYNMGALGAGVDYRLLRSVNLRADYEYQMWLGFPLVSQRPNLVTIGIAYHFHD